MFASLFLRKMIAYDSIVWIIFNFFFAVLGFELRASHFLGRHSTTHLSQSASPFFVLDSFEIGSICLGWHWTMIPLISTSQVARNTGMSHQSLAFFKNFTILSDTPALLYFPQVTYHLLMFSLLLLLLFSLSSF
jgi:hypothetical protein